MKLSNGINLYPNSFSTMKKIFLLMIATLLLAACVPSEHSGEAEEIENDFEVVEVLKQDCERDTDCETPARYAVLSHCPYAAKCLENACSVVCPHPFSGRMVPDTEEEHSEWETIKAAIRNCEVESIFQAHSLAVSAKLKDGTVLEGVEPEIDDILDVAVAAEGECGEIVMATE